MYIYIYDRLLNRKLIQIKLNVCYLIKSRPLFYTSLAVHHTTDLTLKIKKEKITHESDIYL